MVTLMTRQQIIDMVIKESHYVAPRGVSKTFTQLDNLLDSFDREIKRCNNIISIIHDIEHPNICRDVKRGLSQYALLKI